MVVIHRAAAIRPRVQGGGMHAFASTGSRSADLSDRFDVSDGDGGASSSASYASWVVAPRIHGARGGPRRSRRRRNRPATFSVVGRAEIECGTQANGECHE